MGTLRGRVGRTNVCARCLRTTPAMGDRRSGCDPARYKRERSARSEHQGVRAVAHVAASMSHVGRARALSRRWLRVLRGLDVAHRGSRRSASLRPNQKAPHATFDRDDDQDQSGRPEARRPFDGRSMHRRLLRLRADVHRLRGLVPRRAAGRHAQALHPAEPRLRGDLPGDGPDHVAARARQRDDLAAAHPGLRGGVRGVRGRVREAREDARALQGVRGGLSTLRSSVQSARGLIEGSASAARAAGGDHTSVGASHSPRKSSGLTA